MIISCNGVDAGGIAFVLGQTVNQLGKAIYTGKIVLNQNKVV